LNRKVYRNLVPYFGALWTNEKLVTDLYVDNNWCPRHFSSKNNIIHGLSNSVMRNEDWKCFSKTLTKLKSTTYLIFGTKQIRWQCKCCPNTPARCWSLLPWDSRDISWYYASYVLHFIYTRTCTHNSEFRY